MDPVEGAVHEGFHNIMMWTPVLRGLHLHFRV